jgi:hypothetical protein
VNDEGFRWVPGAAMNCTQQFQDVDEERSLIAADGIFTTRCGQRADVSKK